MKLIILFIFCLGAKASADQTLFLGGESHFYVNRGESRFASAYNPRKRALTTPVDREGKGFNEYIYYGEYLPPSVEIGYLFEERIVSTSMDRGQGVCFHRVQIILDARTNDGADGSAYKDYSISCSELQKRGYVKYDADAYYKDNYKINASIYLCSSPKCEEKTLEKYP